MSIMHGGMIDIKGGFMHSIRMLCSSCLWLAIDHHYSVTQLLRYMQLAISNLRLHLRHHELHVRVLLFSHCIFM